MKLLSAIVAIISFVGSRTAAQSMSMSDSSMSMSDSSMSMEDSPPSPPTCPAGHPPCTNPEIDCIPLGFQHCVDNCCTTPASKSGKGTKGSKKRV
ncbi:hypothetical protein ACHAXN_006414 [Cyclotella atomus]